MTVPGKIEWILLTLKEAKGISLRKFAREVGRDPATVSSWAKGRTKPDSEDLGVIFSKFHIRPEWFFSDQGEPFSDQGEPFIEAVGEVAEPLPAYGSAAPPRPTARPPDESWEASLVKEILQSRDIDLIQVLRQNLQQFQAKLRLAKELGNLSQKVSDLESKVQILERLVAKRGLAPRPLARQFGQLAIAEGLLTPEQVALVLKKQQALDGEGHQDRVSPTPQGGA